MNIKNTILLRVRIAFLAILVLSGFLVHRIIDLQSSAGDRWRDLAEQATVQYRAVPAARGNVYADDGSLLATSLPYYRVAFDPSVAGDTLFRANIRALSEQLAGYFGGDAQYYQRRMTKAREDGKQYVMLSQKKINHLEKDELAAWPIFREGRYKGGVIFEPVKLRYKPFGYLGARTVGFVNDNGKGAGLEYSFNQYLAGQDGQGLFQKMQGNHWKPVYDGSEIKPVQGLDIETTIDINLQDVTQASLLSALYEHDAEYGCAVVMEVQTGEIKAISNLTKRKDGKYAEIYNYAVGGLTEPGSTFKLASVIALLEDSGLQLTDTIATGKGTYRFHDRIMRDYKWGGFGTITLKEAFSKSSNIAVSRWVDKYFGLKPSRYIAYLQQMGLTEPLGFQLAGEGVPYIPTPEDKDWSGVTLPWMSIGYSLKLTPLQTLTFYNAIANDGKLMQPLLVKKVTEANQEERVFEAAVLRERICSPATLRKVRQLLESVVQEGTANNIRNDYYRVAGKTGTAKILVNGEYTNNYYTSFAGYFPADRPKYSCVIVINNPKGYQQNGSDVAAPVFKDIADKIYATDLSLHQPLPTQFAREEGVFPVIQAGYRDDLQQICTALHIEQLTTDETTEWVRAQPVNQRIRWKQEAVEENQMPNLQGMTLRDALYLLERQGLRVEYKGAGRVTKQSLSPGESLKKGNTIWLELQS
ncbi:MAG: penicillin-binding protein [Cyclobacteriaceae bacterium]